MGIGNAVRSYTVTTAHVPTVSVIIPTYNRARLLPHAIDSVLEQTLKDVEVLVVDDGSTDATDAVVRQYGNRVRYIKTYNGGVAHARNIGMRHAGGRLFAFLDSDDLYYPYSLELLVRLLDRFPEAALACSEMSGFDDDGFIERYHLKRYHHSAYRDPRVTYDRMFSRAHPVSVLAPLPATLLKDDPDVACRRVYVGNVFDTYLLKLVLCQNSVVMRRELVAEIGERNPAIRHWQEVDFLLRITRHHCVCFVDVPTYRLRYHAGQVSTTSGPDGLYRWIRKQQILLRVVKRHALADAAYYRSRRAAIDRHLAHLHRAVAVPLLLSSGSPRLGRRYARYARLYLRRCAQYGHPARAVRLAAAMPAPVRRLAVQLIETARQLWWRGVQLVTSSGSWRGVAAAAEGSGL